VAGSVSLNSIRLIIHHDFSPFDVPCYANHDFNPLLIQVSEQEEVSECVLMVWCDIVCDISIFCCYPFIIFPLHHHISGLV
jgi:hypothetical protein